MAEKWVVMAGFSIYLGKSRTRLVAGGNVDPYIATFDTEEEAKAAARAANARKWTTKIPSCGFSAGRHS